MKRWLGALACCAAACGPTTSQPPSAIGHESRAIIGGVNDPNDPAVVLVIADNGQGGISLCTGEVVSPHVVLTAAHCVDPTEVGNGNTFSIFLGSDYNNAGQANNNANYVAVKETHYDLKFNGNNLGAGHDVGIVVTKTAMNIKPLSISHTPLTNNDIGVTLRLIGYGINNGNDTQGTSAGTKRETTTPLSAFDNVLLQFTDGNHNTCEGDSGGPALVVRNGGEVIVGITSFGDKGCTQGGYDTRVDVWAAADIDPYIVANDPQMMMQGPPDMAVMHVQAPPDLSMAQGPHPTPDLAMVRHGSSDAHFNVSDGGAGNVGNDIGANCQAHADCASGICAFVTADSGYCTAACNPTDPQPCPAGFSCGIIDGANYCLQVSESGYRHGGGCRMAGSASGDTWVLGLALTAMGLVRRRRRG